MSAFIRIVYGFENFIFKSVTEVLAQIYILLSVLSAVEMITRGKDIPSVGCSRCFIFLSSRFRIATYLWISIFSASRLCAILSLRSWIFSIFASISSLLQATFFLQLTIFPSRFKIPAAISTLIASYTRRRTFFSSLSLSEPDEYVNSFISYIATSVYDVDSDLWIDCFTNEVRYLRPLVLRGVS
jgi:hypothetical protein